MHTSTDLYEIESYTGKSLKAPKGHAFIYVLTFNFGKLDSKVVPFYVGQAVNLRSRFASHSQISWHYGKFGNPVQVYILGSVRLSDAGRAEQDMINKLSDFDYKLTNVLIHNEYAKHIQSNHNITRWTVEQISAYSNAMPRSQAIKEWKERWINPLKRSRKKIISEPNPSKLIVESYFRFNKIQFGNDLSELINTKLTENYDEATGCSTLTLKKSLKGDDIRRAVSILNTIWVPSENNRVGGGSVHSFQLVSGARKLINAYGRGEV